MPQSNQASRLHHYLTAGSKKVGGWASPLLFSRVMQLDALQHELGVGGHVGEIGVHHGKLFLLLHLLRRPGEKGVAIDLFEDQELNVDHSGRGERDIFLRNVEQMAGDLSNLEVLATDSTRIGGDDVIRLAGGGLRLFSIDGGHLSHIVSHDLATAASCMVPGGIVLVDDYLNPEFPGVAEGTLAFLSGNNALRPFCVSTQKLYLTTGGHEQTYAAMLYEAETGRSFDKRVKYNFAPGINGPVRTADLLGAEVLCYSDDLYSRAQQSRRRIKRVQRDLRNWLSDTDAWKQIRDSRAGAVLKRVSRIVLPPQ